MNARVVVALAVCARIASAQGSLADVDILQIPKNQRPVNATCADIDGDGTREVLIAVRARGKDFVRSIQVWKRGATGYAMSEEVPLTRDVVAWATGDVLASAGTEIVLFNQSGVFARASSGPPEQRLQRLCAVEFLWQLADPQETFLHQDCLRDLDGDGLVDLALPEPDGYRVVLQRRPREGDAPWGVESRPRVPPECNEEGVWVSASSSEGPSVRGHKQSDEFRLSFSGGDDDATDRLGPLNLLQVNEAVPAPAWIDWDGDKDLDLLAQTSRSLFVWRQDKGAWNAAPDITLALPVEADRSRKLDASYSSHAVDLDADGKADCVVFAGDRRSEDVRTQGMFFAQAAANADHPLFGAEGRPRDVLVFAGFVTNPTFVDVDGDGLPDLVLRTVRPDLIDQIRSAANKAIEADLFVYLNRKGTFPRQPDLTWHHAIPIERFELTTEFVGDLTGDGVRDLLVRDEPKRLRALMVRRPPKGGAWSVVAQPVWQLDVHEDAEVLRVDVPPKARPELLIIEPNQVLYARFK